MVPRVVGSGAYNMEDFKRALKPVMREALAQGGAAIGGLVPGGSSFGRELGRRLSKLIGSGDYETNTSVNELIHPPGGLASATFGEDANTIRIRRREFLTDVLAPSTAGTFKVYAYPINAGMRTTFPFLSQMAANYQEYCFDGLVFEFISSASPYVSASSLGTVIASMNYNSSEPDFPNKYTMENSSFAISTRVDKNLMYGVECAKGSNPQNCYYVRDGNSVLPLTTTDLGKFQIALATATTVPANAVLGELWVTYDVVMKRPVLSPSRYGVHHSVRSGASATNPMGTGWLAGQTSLGSNPFTLLSGSSWSFKDAIVGDVFMLTYSFTATVVNTGTFNVGILNAAGTGGASGYVVHNGFASASTADSQSSIAGGRNGSGTYVGGVISINFSVLFTITETSGTLVMDTATNTNWPTGTCSGEAVIVNLGNGIVPADW